MKIRWTRWTLVIVATLFTLGLSAGLAPASPEQPKLPVFAERPLPLEWNGARPDPEIARMFRRGAAVRPHLDDMFRRRR